MPAWICSKCAVQYADTDRPPHHCSICEDERQGISPDEQTLAYVSVEPEGDEPRARRNLAAIPAAGGPDNQITEGVNEYDGPEYSPDGEWIYYNS